MVIKIKLYPIFGNFVAVNLFGFIFTTRDLNSIELNHELIHSAQQRELLYIIFYIWYVIEWFVLLIKYKDWNVAYRNICFEKEAYKHQSDLRYLEKRKHLRFIFFHHIKF